MFRRVFHFAPALKGQLLPTMCPSSHPDRFRPSMNTRFDAIGQRIDSDEPISRKLTHYLAARDRYSAHSHLIKANTIGHRIRVNRA